MVGYQSVSLNKCKAGMVVVILCADIQY